MARQKRLIIPNFPHHVIQRGNNRQNIFFDKSDRFYLLSKIKKICMKEHVSVGAYCLMTNHYHLLLYPETAQGLIQFMKSINQLYTQFINWKYSRTGKLWENRYKLHLVEPGHDRIIMRYIERNPLRARMVDQAEDYPYSSARGHLCQYQDNVLSEKVLRREKADYKHFFYEAEAYETSHIKFIKTLIQQQKILGQDTFIHNLEKEYEVNLKLRKVGRPRK